MLGATIFSIVIIVLNFGLPKFAGRLVKRVPLEKHNFFLCLSFLGLLKSKLKWISDYNISIMNLQQIINNTFK